MSKKYVIGVDLGGTKIAAALCGDRCEILSKIKTETRAEEGEESVVERIKGAIREVAAHSGVGLDEVSGIGISSPGPLSVSQGVVLYAATLGWENVPIRDLIQGEFNIPAYLENDANVAAFGEKCLGAGKGRDDLIYVTVSTGIGSGIITGGKIYHGKHDAAGEFGHICIERGGRQCSCGNKGCLQAYASGTAIAQIALENVAYLRTSRIWELSGGNVDRIDCLTVEKAARASDKLAAEIWRQAGERLGHGISVLLQLFDPEAVIIGGGVSKAMDLFREPMERVIREHTYELISKNMRIVPAELGQDAGVVGAAMIALRDII